MLQYLKAKFSIDHKLIREQIRDFNSSQDMRALLAIFGQIYLNYEEVIAKFARQSNCGASYLAYKDLVGVYTVLCSILRQAVLERKMTLLVQLFQDEMKYQELATLSFDYGQMICSDFRVWKRLDADLEQLIENICNLSVKVKYNDDRAADQLVQVLRECYAFSSVYEYKTLFHFDSINVGAEIELFYRIIVAPIMHIQFLRFRQYADRLFDQNAAGRLRDPVFLFQLEQRLAKLETTVLNVYRPMLFSIANLELNRLFWYLRACNSELSLYFHVLALAHFTHTAFDSIFQYWKSRQFKECRPTSSSFYLVRQALTHNFLYSDATLLSRANLYDILLSHIFGQSSNNDGYLMDKFVFEIEDFSRNLALEAPPPLEWYPYPLETMTYDLRFVGIEDLLAVVKPMQFNVLNVLFRSNSVREFLDLMVKAQKTTQLYYLLDNIQLPYDNSYQFQVFKDDFAQLQHDCDTHFDLQSVKLRDQYAYFQNVLKSYQISYTLDRLAFILDCFNVRVPKIYELDQQIDESSVKQLAFAVSYVKYRQLSSLQPLLDFKDHIVFYLLQQIENEQHQIEPDWRKWENKLALDFVKQIEAAKDSEKPLVVQQQFQFTIQRILALLQYSAKIQSKYQQLINKLGKQTQYFETYFGKQFALYFAIKFLINNAYVFKFILYQTACNQKMFKLFKGNGTTLQFLMNVHLNIPDVQQAILEVYYWDIYNEAMAFYKQPGNDREILKRIQLLHNSNSDLFYYYLIFVMVCQLPELSQKQYLLLQQRRKSHLENIVHFLLCERAEVMTLYPAYRDYYANLQGVETAFEQFYFSFLLQSGMYIKPDFDRLFAKNSYVRTKLLEMQDDVSGQDWMSVTTYNNETIEMIQAFDSRLDAFSDAEACGSDVSLQDFEFGGDDIEELDSTL